MRSLDFDRGPTPFAPDFVGDAIDTSRGAIGAESGGLAAAVIALASATTAVVMLAAVAILAPA